MEVRADAARRVSCPALVIIAANDIMTPPEAGRELARLIAGAASVTIADCGHMLVAEAPDAVLDALIDFFARRPERPERGPQAANGSATIAGGGRARQGKQGSRRLQAAAGAAPGCNPRSGGEGVLGRIDLPTAAAWHADIASARRNPVSTMRRPPTSAPLRAAWALAGAADLRSAAPARRGARRRRAVLRLRPRRAPGRDGIWQRQFRYRKGYSVRTTHNQLATMYQSPCSSWDVNCIR